MNAAKIIRDARRRAGLTQRLLARRARTSHSTLAAYESGAKVPTLATLERIVGAAGFRLEVELVADAPFESHADRAEAIERVLALAEEFPTRHSAELAFPPMALLVR